MQETIVDPLICTKFSPPGKSDHIVVRHRLLDQILARPQSKLTLLSAPAGFGKTTVLRQAYLGFVERGYRSCWLSLDRSDDNPLTFFRYFIASLQTLAVPGLTEILTLVESSTDGDIGKGLSALVNQLSDSDEDITLFLDDYHFISSSEIHGFLELLLNLTNEKFSVVMGSRLSPEISLDTMRVNQSLYEVDADALRFTMEEMRTFMTVGRKIALNAEEMKILYGQSDGWIAGLQLASLYLEGGSGTCDKLKSFSGNLRDVADYLAANVLEEMSEDLQNFLLTTSILDRFNARVCNAVLDALDSEQYINILERRNLFILPLDDKREWYRYHHLFQQFLLDRFRMTAPDNLSRYYLRASNWFDTNGHFDEAVDYALQATDYELAAQLIERHAFTEFLAGDMPKIDSLIREIPESIQINHPDLLMRHGTALYHMGKIDRAETVRLKAQKSIDHLQVNGRLSSEKLHNLNLEMKVLQAGIYMSLDKNEEVIELIPEDFDAGSVFLEGTIHNVLGYSHGALGSFALARQHLSLAKELHLQAERDFGLVYADVFLGLFEIEQGRLRRAQDIYRWLNTDDDSGRRSINVAPVIELMNGVLALEVNDVDMAAKLLHGSFAAVEAMSHISVLLQGYRAITRLYSLQKNYNAALDLLTRAVELQRHSLNFESFNLQIDSIRIPVLLRSGQSAEAWRLALGHQIPLDGAGGGLPVNWNRDSYTKRWLQLQLMLAAGQVGESIAGLQEYIEALDGFGYVYRAIEGRILLAKAYDLAGDTANSEAMLAKAVVGGSGDNLVLLFLEAGESLRPVLKRLAGSDKCKDPLSQHFLGVVQNALSTKDDNTQLGAKACGLIEPLSAREMDVLSLMSQGQANNAIAASLYISEKTVKWHVTNIFGKLGVRNRTSAVITARELEILPV